ncbi:MAG: alpha/beta fold hydrolase [Clostridia bacterium]|nr:alpha/beta fold hydrolase [Clostridia bacterium]
MRKRNKRFKGILTALVVVAVVAVVLKNALFPKTEPLALTGRYAVASRDYWVTEDREDPFRNDGAKREVQVRAWYPENFGVADEKHPVVVASHGSCGSVDNNLSLYRELASHGYTVLAVGHPGHAFSVGHSDGKKQFVAGTYLKSMGTMDPQKKPEEAAKLFSEWMKLRMEDLNAVMDDFSGRAAENAEFRSADPTRFITIGHSAGGSAALGMARVRKDVVAVIALEAPFMYDIKGVSGGAYVFDDSDYGIPVLHVYSDASWEHLREWKQYRNNVKFLAGGEAGYRNLHYAGTGHMGLCDLSLASPVFAKLLDGGIGAKDPRVPLAQLNADSVAFLRDFGL